MRAEGTRRKAAASEDQAKSGEDVESDTCERDFFIDNFLVRIHFIIWMIISRQALRHGSLNSLFHVG